MNNKAHPMTNVADPYSEALAGPDESPALVWESLRARLASADGQLFWRSFDELAETPEFLDYVSREFPRQSGEGMAPEDRREFLKLMAASLGLAGVGLSGCMRQPTEKIVPYVRQPEDFVPGNPLYFATCMTLGGYAMGLLVESHLGRPTKVEGNPQHPASLGATDAFAQASILSLYDPDRSQTVMRGGQISTWGEFLTALAAELPDLRKRHGKGLAILTETVTSPTLADQLHSLLAELPEAKWHQYEPVGRDNVRDGAKLAFGEHVDTIYHFDQADVVVALDAEFLTAMPGSVRYARDFIDRRKLARGEQQADGAPHAMSRLYALESTPGLAGAVADHRLPIRADEIEGFVRALAAQLSVEVEVGQAEAISDANAPWLAALASDLTAHKEASAVIVGDGQPAIVHALVHAINRALGNVGKTVEYVPSIEAEPINQIASLKELVESMRQGEVELLLVLGGNPIYNAPGALEFGKHYETVKLRVHLADDFDETSFASHWHIPAAHYLESWGDARAFDGTTTIQQPLIAPLYQGRTIYEMVAVLQGHPELAAYDIVRGYWKRILGDGEFESRWRKALHDGLMADTRAESYKPEWSLQSETSAATSPNAGELGLEVTFCPDPTIWDGRFANNGWLQELPKPLTKLTWDNAALVSPRTAERLGVSNYDLVELSRDGQTIRAPIWIVPGQPHDSISLALGYGRTRSGRIGNGRGANAYILRSAEPAWFLSGVELKRTGERRSLAVTQNHHSMEGRGLVQLATLDQFQQNPEFIDPELRHPEILPTLLPQFEESENAWGMVIDQTACIGCNACVVACQAENNIPIVGKEQVGKGREMHWLRIDRYYKGDLDSPDAYFQPVACMHCEKAPCELVCPVGATVHSHEGLNQMVYNRCVGTRYCSNNCPYKVRRFNFLNYDAEFGYTGEQAPVLKLLRNPDVTVRSRGVMEKCTYCVQRINAAKITAQKEDRPVGDGEIVTACQAVCPTKAIVFGNLRDRNSQVARFKESPLNYSLLADLNTLPRTTYLARIRNPNAALGAPATIDTPPIEPTILDRVLERGAP